ncbi:ABC transporter permease [Pseudosulfitobacter pseudonitzschiae]|uniref:ABC transporter permease n=1 Tax=Pseudosulfitobacter pseudonitzschiae TaxID=1402135 RepID=UPI001AF1018B|nr:ABC transporter permease subunit [Pseudosulfitobacter pseudonitzschiae]MBM1813770.1 ABC transporter permease subunit [Pseudosulfitobacter pseudonitzschiae]MBM1830763.1 ABC transporter permease subunit [Pseudosulfitobacter pseudonitzschiae]MBM1835630.1 ABC transporter permease subunit [Pseudosulfitobacter pseudonitzschiae]MBM1840476.1 ABC transporter permease subunit [Pseudosulfitobacter pseudonitzschiae]MBM1845536.1 ABC transporter permease subunit [Pseudosulfitobacter pseudonitzschiae]
MFSYCADPSTLGGLTWLSCFLTTGVHLSFYLSFLKVLGLLAVTAPVALAFGFLGAMAARASFAPLSWLGKGYIAIVRGVPDIAFFLFFVIALDQLFEYTRHRILCPDWDQPVRQGNDFIVCQAAKLPLGSSPEWMHETYAFGLAVITFAIIFGAFAANVLFGAMRAVPRAQLETGEAYGMTQRQTFWRILVPQMWVFALLGLSNLWMVLIKATPLLFLLGIEDIVYWARELGGTKTSKFTSYPHGDWRMWYFLALLIFYLLMTKVSETLLGRLMARLTLGQATAGGEAQRKAA